MYSFLRHLLMHSTKKDLQLKKELFDIENDFLDEELTKDGHILENQANDTSFNNNIIDKDTDSAAGIPDHNETCTPCSKRKGVITHLTTTNGTIDNSIKFDKKIAPCFQDLHTGCVVEYIVYKTENNVEKIVKIESITEHNWEETTETKTQEMLELLQLEKPTYFNTQQRNILGVIKQRLASSIEVETDYGELTVKLDNTELSFIPRKGDAVCLECKVQLDEGYVDKQGEILEVTKVIPARIQTDQRCVVERVFEDFSELSTDAYVLKEDLPSGIDLHLGDIVNVDLIECTLNRFSLRAVKLTLLEKNFGKVKKILPDTSTQRRAVSIEGKDHLIFSEQWKKEKVTFKLRNNTNRVFNLQQIIIQNTANTQISVVEPLSSRQIEAEDQISLILEVHTKFIGESKECFTLVFDTFKVNRYLTIIVCESELVAKEAELRVIASDQLKVTGRTVSQRSRFYTNQVWSNKNPMVPGEAMMTKRRFVKRNFKMYEVPLSLRDIILCSMHRIQMEDRLNNDYPFLREPLTFDNYVQRFGLLLHLEEIECTVNIRNFDRERTYFQREGEYLSLQIEDLAERRPSIVIGDSVRATNPFEGVDAKSYEGIVHKVLFNRVLLKFNAGFHEKYNGEDYRVTFHFSRTSIRKQHHSVERIVSTLGEPFLFPNKVTMRSNPQLDVIFKDDNMYLYDVKLPWFNTSLNSIQKRAVFNILRGEAENMPYVIFGPPGTGKTVTLVESMLQLIRNLPCARLLIGTPSNSSADLLTKRIIDSKVLPQGDFVRLVSLNHVEKDLIPEEIKTYCATNDYGIANTCKDNMIVTDSGLKLRCQSKFLCLHRVIISTCSTLGNFHQMDIPRGHFTHVLIDEAGQCCEPESVVPIALLRNNRSQVVLAGDPHQLQGMVLNLKAVDFGLSISLLERLLQRSPYCKDLLRFPDSSGYNPCILTKLLNNYRAIPSIMSVYSKLFYDNELISMVSENESREAVLLQNLLTIFEPNTTMPRTHGTFFHGIMGENMQEEDSPSWYNPAEARQVFLTTIQLYRRKVHPDQIGIVTPYCKQVKALRNLFICSDMVMPKIGTIEEFQGQERDIILISTVRSSHSVLKSDARLNLGFVRCKKRMNVAISRARCLMIVFGNPELLSADESWSKLITFCCNNNAYFGCELPIHLSSDEGQEDNDKETYDYVP
ncbi:probable RNA helicase armi isoform X2 [Drosophila innubila]|uniref:probable RNA helicase armi isoform X1 n=1 Tax=Drosophila innubila TaxID=198719 RepID=UPI00148CD0F5|nr:probable RNA helicase armi isoform X1 [Drosophila innubila]XP_034487235.1 probable RNA helicase armi isoform X2 [Drosophila innubila]